jgi:hypothetical protein
MSRLLWVAVGAAAAVAGAKRLGLLDGVTGAPAPHGAHAGGSAPGATTAATTAARAVRTAFRAGATTAGAVRSFSDARREFRVGMAEREEQLRHDLVGDVDVDAIRAERAARRGERDADVSGATPPAWQREPADRDAARAARSRHGWADGPTDDPEDDDGDVPYSFY